MIKTPKSKGFLTPQEVANRLGICRTTVWRYIRKKRLKVIKLTEKNYRISEKDLENFLKKIRTK